MGATNKIQPIDLKRTVALSMADLASGGIKSVKTTPLVTTDELIEGMKMASGSGYQPPAS